MPQQRWTREQDLAVLYVKLEHQLGLEPKHPTSRTLAEAMNRTNASILYRIGNFDYLDPSVPGGWSNYAKLTKEIWDEYVQDPKRVLVEARRAYLDLVQ